MTTRHTVARLAYDVSGRFILIWCVTTAFLSLITLGLYLPFALNNLVRHLCNNIEVQIRWSETRPEAATGAEARANTDDVVPYESFEWQP